VHSTPILVRRSGVSSFVSPQMRHRGDAPPSATFDIIILSAAYSFTDAGFNVFHLSQTLSHGNVAISAHFAL
jgi:hypothetical protein